MVTTPEQPEQIDREETCPCCGAPCEVSTIMPRAVIRQDEDGVYYTAYTHGEKMYHHRRLGIEQGKRMAGGEVERGWLIEEDACPGHHRMEHPRAGSPHRSRRKAVTDKATMTLNLSEREMTVVKALADEQGLSKTQLLRCALRLYQLVHERIKAGETMSFSGDKERIALFIGPGFGVPSHDD